MRANPEALERILEADMIVIGPGSLFSSILPNLLISDIQRRAARPRPGLRVYVCNVATQPGETAAMTASAHLRALFDHVGDELVDCVDREPQHRRATARGLARASPWRSTCAGSRSCRS